MGYRTYLGDGSGGARENRGMVDSSPRDHCSSGGDNGADDESEEGEEEEDDGIDVKEEPNGDGL